MATIEVRLTTCDECGVELPDHGHGARIVFDDGSSIETHRCGQHSLKPLSGMHRWPGGGKVQKTTVEAIQRLHGEKA